MSGGGTFPQKIGIVAIGRNEGDRLKACVRSIPAGVPLIYVDSGSSDDSAAFARQHGATVVELDMAQPFTAARARNAGRRALAEQFPALSAIQFVDGDCVIEPSWLETASAALSANPRLAAVFGRRREKFPEATLYNRLCDDEWNVLVGLVASCGGDVLMRAEAFDEAGGYADDLIAGEEPDLCLRLGQKGWLIERIDAPMTLHDAAMSRFGQWWRRAQRSGHAYAEHVWRHGQNAFHDWRRQLASILLWGALFPAVMIAGTLICLTLLNAGCRLAAIIPLLAVPCIYAGQWLRIMVRKRKSGADTGFAARYAALMLLGKFAEFTGVLRCWLGHAAGRKAHIIEYKAPPA